MKKLNKIKIYEENTLKFWSEGRLKRWRGRVENHLDGIKKDHKDKNGASYDIKQFDEYIKLINNIIKIKEEEEFSYSIIDNNMGDDISG